MAKHWALGAKLPRPLWGRHPPRPLMCSPAQKLPKSPQSQGFYNSNLQPPFATRKMGVRLKVHISNTSLVFLVTSSHPEALQGPTLCSQKGLLWIAKDTPITQELCARSQGQRANIFIIHKYRFLYTVLESCNPAILIYFNLSVHL